MSLDDLTVGDSRSEAITRIIAMAHALQESRLAALLANLSGDEAALITRPIIEKLCQLCSEALNEPRGEPS